MASHYVFVSNIPSDFHSADLRNFFSDFVESEKFHCFHFRHRPQSEVLQLKPVIRNLQDGHKKQQKVESKYLTANPVCCILKCENAKEKVEIVKKYHFQHWVDSKENILTSRCVIVVVKLDSSLDSSVIPSVVATPSKVEVVLPKDKTENMMELKPPMIMPNGNVGTPTKHFLNLISTCQIPSKLIGKLGLRFTKSKSNRKYGTVPFDYGTTVSEDYKEENYTYQSTTNTSRRMNDSPDEPNEKLDDEEEEWDRHEALHNDVTEQERNKERLFEEEEEVVWEKGGPGIVWYTDAQVWREAEGDFDEQTADDWDVDFSVYHEEGGGDKDARDAVEMRKSEMWREGNMETVFKKPKSRHPKTANFVPYQKPDKDTVGPFEQYTRGIGRRLMERHGWVDGLGLGSSQKGITKPIESDGQKPKERKGLGYFGVPLRLFTPVTSVRPSTSGVRIATVFDRPADTDPKEPLLRSNQPNFMKFRH